MKITLEIDRDVLEAAHDLLVYGIEERDYFVKHSPDAGRYDDEELREIRKSIGKAREASAVLNRVLWPE